MRRSSMTAAGGQISQSAKTRNNGQIRTQLKSFENKSKILGTLFAIEHECLNPKAALINLVTTAKQMVN